MISVEPGKRLVDWSKLNRRLPIIASHVIAFAVGGWAVSIRAQEAELPYKDRATHKLERLQAVAGPNPLATINCERRRGTVAEVVAVQAVRLSSYQAVSGDLLDKIPDCPRRRTPPTLGALTR